MKYEDLLSRLYSMQNDLHIIGKDITEIHKALNVMIEKIKPLYEEEFKNGRRKNLKKED